MNIDNFLSRFDAVKKTSAGWIAMCPAHEGQRRALSIAAADGRILLDCKAGCATKDVLAAKGLTMRDLFVNNGDRPERKIVATYDYVDENGVPLFQVVRFRPKDFRQRRPDGAGGWIWHLDKTRRVLYRLPKVVQAAAAGFVVYICEGEKDVASLEKTGAIATTNPGGAEKWRDEYSDALRGAQVVVVADKDEPGRKHAAQVAASLQGKAASVRIVEAKAGKDAADHLAAGFGLDDFVAAEPTEPASDTSERPRPQSYSGPEIAAMTFPDPDPVLLYAERGTTFDVVGKMKAGKTTFVLLACRAALRGQPFLDLPTKRVKVLYLTEQSRRSFRDKLRSLELLREPDLRVLFRSDFIGWTWKTICQFIGEQVVTWDITLLVVDTLSDWAQLENENDAAEALRVMDPLRTIAEDGVAVVTVRHAGKGKHGGEDVVDVGRGSSAFAGAVDTLCVLEGAPGSGHPNRRQLRLVSRKDDVPPTMIIELKSGGYVALGSSPNVDYRAARTAWLEHLPSSEEAALPVRDLWKMMDKAFSERTAKRAIDALCAEGIATGRKGAGRATRGDQDAYWFREDDGERRMGDEDDD